MSSEYAYFDPGPLIDGELELVPASVAWLDAMLAAQLYSWVGQESPPDDTTSRQRHLDFLARLDRGFDAGDEDGQHIPSYHFWMLKRGAQNLPIVGGIGLRLGNGKNIEQVIGHIGYHVYPFARGHRYAERACRLLLPLARQHRLEPLWITCNPDNLPSRHTCERLGAKLVDIVKVPSDHPLYARGEREKCRYRL